MMNADMSSSFASEGIVAFFTNTKDADERSKIVQNVLQANPPVAMMKLIKFKRASKTTRLLSFILTTLIVTPLLLRMGSELHILVAGAAVREGIMGGTWMAFVSVELSLGKWVAEE